MTDQTWFDLPPETTVELIAAAPLLDLGYKPAEVAIRRCQDDFTLIGILIAKPRPACCHVVPILYRGPFLTEAIEAELKIKHESPQVIIMEDVIAVIAMMGKPDEIDQEENPKSKNAFEDGGKGDKRFFRNPDDKVIAGLCSGIASYFHLDPVWVRLIFLVFCFAGGSGVLLYLVLWVVIPEAQTTTDKLEMRGEKINIKNIVLGNGTCFIKNNGINFGKAFHH